MFSRKFFSLCLKGKFDLKSCFVILTEEVGLKFFWATFLLLNLWVEFFHPFKIPSTLLPPIIIFMPPINKGHFYTSGIFPPIKISKIKGNYKTFEMSKKNG